jgi:hypothetical protein
MQHMKRLTVDLPDETYRKLKISCATEDSRMVDVVRKLLDEHLTAAGHLSAIKNSDVTATEGPCVGMMHAENAVWQLEKISRDDREHSKALQYVSQWIALKLESLKTKKR